MGLCRWMGLHFHVWIDYNGIAFPRRLLEWGLRKFFIFTVRKRTRMFVLQLKSKEFFIEFKNWVNSF